MSKKLFLIPILLIGLYLIACFFGPIAYKGEQETKIDGSYPLVYLFLNDIRDWPKWYSWSKTDPSLKFSSGGREVNVGASFTFDGNSYGKGLVEVLESEQDSFVTVRMKNNKWPSDLMLNWQIIPQGNQFVYVKCFARLKKPIPFFKRALYLAMPSKLDYMLKEDMAGLKGYIEGLVQSDFGVKQDTFKNKIYYGIMEPILSSKLPSFFARAYPKIYKYLDSVNVKYIGPPVNLTLDWEGTSGYVYAMAALPIEKNIRPGIGFDILEVKDNPCIKLEHYGSYKTLRNAHAKLDYLFRRNNQVIDKPIIEEYVTSPSQEPDTSKWLTNIYYLIYTGGQKNSIITKTKTLDDIKKEEEDQRKQELEEYNKRNQ
ncbi:MAG: GyrI-like domain-containing protein [Saprospiraceae bacterium]|nr:GyrI-like domain-containing protein [Saprospiraceae bacterium]